MGPRSLSAVLVIVLAALVASTPVHAQSTTGTIDGIVLDPNDQALPGVTIIANSPALMQSDLTVVSNASGYYRLPLLPPGSYELAFELQGFRSQRRAGVAVRVGQTTAVDTQLELAPVEDTALVTGEIPTIDPRAAKIAFNYTENLTHNIPTARNNDDLFATVPGVESASVLGVSQPGVFEAQNVLGSGERSNFYRLDGANATDPAGQWGVQSLMPYDAIEEVQVVKAAKPAEIPFNGGFFNVITKSGGNRLSGEIGAFYEDDALQSTNAEDLREEHGLDATNKLESGYEISAGLGGRFIPDKLWWYGSARRLEKTTTILGFPADIDDEVNSYFGKLTYQPAQGHRIAAIASHWNQAVSHFFVGFSPSLAVDEEASVDRPLFGTTVGLRWSAVFGDRMVAEFNASTSHQGFDQKAQPDAGVPVIDLVTDRRSEGPPGGTRDQDNEIWSLEGSLAYFVPDAAGRHDFKGGFEYRPSEMNILFDDIGDHRLNTIFGRPFSVRILNTPVDSTLKNTYVSAFLQDAWTIADRLTIDVGLRYSRAHASTPEQPTGGGDFAGTALAQRFPELEASVVPPTDLITWNNVEPRLAVTYSLGRSGRTVLRAGASRYYQNLGSFDLFGSNPSFPFNFIVLWNDLNGDRAFQVGEDGPLLARFGGQLTGIDPDLRQPYTDELMVGISHQLADDLQVSANFVYRRDEDVLNNIDLGVPFDSYTPVQVADPGPDGIPGTADDGALTVFAQDPATLGNSRDLMTNPPASDRTYRGMELTASKRLADSWQAVASLVVSELEVIRPTTVPTIDGLFDNPNSLINAEGLDPRNPTVQLKLQGTYIFDFGLSASGFYRYASGNPYTRELVVTGLPQGPITVFAEPRGSSRTDASSILDLRLEQAFDVAAGRLGIVLDAFNVFNSAPVTDEGTRTGIDFGDPRAVHPPRLARLAVRFSW